MMFPEMIRVKVPVVEWGSGEDYRTMVRRRGSRIVEVSRELYTRAVEAGQGISKETRNPDQARLRTAYYLWLASVEPTEQTEEEAYCKGEPLLCSACGNPLVGRQISYYRHTHCAVHFGEDARDKHNRLQRAYVEHFDSVGWGPVTRRDGSQEWPTFERWAAGKIV